MEPGQAMSSCAFNMLFTKNVPHILEKIFLSVDYESFLRSAQRCVSHGVSYSPQSHIK